MSHLLKTIRNLLQEIFESIDISDMGDGHYRVSTREACSNKNLKLTKFVGSSSQVWPQTAARVNQLQKMPYDFA